MHIVSSLLSAELAQRLVQVNQFYGLTLSHLYQVDSSV